MNGLIPIRVFVCVIAALACIYPASGQRSERRAENALAAAGGEKAAREMVEVMMMVRLSRELELSEEETVLLVRRVSEFREEQGRMNRQRRRLMGELRSVAQETGKDEEIRAKLDKLKELDRRLNNIKLDLHERLSEGLEARQQARLYVFLQEFEEHMRRMIQRVRERSRAMESGQMGRDGTGRGVPPPPRMMRDRLPRGSQDGGNAGDSDIGEPSSKRAEPDRS